MTVQDILFYPEQQAALRKKSKLVRAVNRQVQALVEDLKDTLMAHSEGVGLVAPRLTGTSA